MPINVSKLKEIPQNSDACLCSTLLSLWLFTVCWLGVKKGNVLNTEMSKIWKSEGKMCHIVSVLEVNVSSRFICNTTLVLLASVVPFPPLLLTSSNALLWNLQSFIISDLLPYLKHPNYLWHITLLGCFFDLISCSNSNYKSSFIKLFLFQGNSVNGKIALEFS